MIIVGHRGAMGYAPENTLLSFQKAIDLGCDKTELDVRLSKDQAVIVIHDDSVDRVSDGHGLIANLTLGKIKSFHCPQGQKIPTLQEVVDLCKNKIDLQIELKAEGTPAAVNDCLIKNNIIDRTVVTSFEIELLEEIKRLNPKIKVGYLFRKYPEKITEFIRPDLLNYLCPRFNIVDQTLIDLAHQAGIKIYAYHLNDQAIAKNLLALGVDEIGTDYPDYFIHQG